MTAAHDLSADSDIQDMMNGIGIAAKGRGPGTRQCVR